MTARHEAAVTHQDASITRVFDAPLVPHQANICEEAHGMSTITFTITVFKAAPQMAGALAGIEAGWSQCLDRTGRSNGSC